MNGLAVCAGIGGLELGLKLALGEHYKTVCYIERHSYCASTLVARMEEKTLDYAPIWDDIKSFDGNPWRGKVDILSGGYPCQPFSEMGKKLGELDERHLWPDIYRIIKEIQPRYCFFENVYGHLRNGFGLVWSNLREAGFKTQCGLFTATEVGAPHARKRLFILAVNENSKADAPRVMGDPNGLRWPWEGRDEIETFPAWDRLPFPPSPDLVGDAWRTIVDREPWLAPALPFQGHEDEAEPTLRRMVNGVSDRVERLTAVGNGVVPIVAAKAFVYLAAQLGIGT